jgi:recombination protein RecA
MKEAGIEDPYTEVTPVVIYQEERGDVALDNVIKAIRSNQFAMVVVDSLGAAKSSAWLYEKDVQDFSDYDRSPKMIGDYTARALTTCNARYDENNILCKDGEFSNQTTVINIAQIYTNIGSQAHSPWKQYSIKGGEGSKHNHHAIVYVWKGEQLRQEKALAEGRPYIYGGEIKMICIKSKICPPWRQGAVRFYFDNFEDFRTGSMDVARDLLGLALQAGTIQARGSHYYVGEEPIGNGKDAASAYLRENKDWFDYIHEITRKALA